MIKRERYMERIRPFIDGELIKVMTGIRRSGKSVMLELIRDELITRGINSDQFIVYNFEDMRNAHLCTANALHDEILSRIKNIAGKAYLFFDEIQEVTNWEKCINSFRVEFDCDIYITGSNAKLLSGELATYLSGRYVEFVIYPFSFSEFLELNNEPKELAFRQYLSLGGMPFLSKLNYEQEACLQYLNDVYNSLVLKDIVKRNNIRDVDLLERIMIYIIANIGQPFSATSISKYFKSENRAVSPETVLNYLKSCEESFLLYRVKRQDIVGKKILTINEKYYIADHGIREAVYGKNFTDMNLVLENIVFLELLRRGYNVTVGKTPTQEIDFIAEKGNKQIYIQVAYLLASPETIEREFGAYRSVRDNFPKYVLSLDEFDMSRDGIIHRNVRDFLLDQSE